MHQRCDPEPARMPRGPGEACHDKTDEAKALCQVEQRPARRSADCNDHVSDPLQCRAVLGDNARPHGIPDRFDEPPLRVIRAGQGPSALCKQPRAGHIQSGDARQVQRQILPGAADLSAYILQSDKRDMSRQAMRRRVDRFIHRATQGRLRRSD
jgi:hypothetical protein